MDENKFLLTGVLIWMDDTKIFSPYFKKRDFKIRISDVDFRGNTVERKIKLTVHNDNCEMLEDTRIDDVIQVKFYIDGKDVIKDGKEYNFTTLVGYDIIVINSVSRSTQEMREAVITKEGLLFESGAKEVTIEDMMLGKKHEEEFPVEIKTEEPFDDLPF